MKNNRTIEEKNIMIAKFMDSNQTEELNYNISIALQQPVLDKIHEMGFVVEILICLGYSCRIHKANFREQNSIIQFEHRDVKVEEAIFETMVQVIEYINVSKLADDKLSMRFSRLHHLGFSFNGDEFVYEDSETTKILSKSQVEEFSTENWNSYCVEMWGINDLKRKRENKRRLALQLNETLLAAAMNVVKYAKRSEDRKTMVIEPIKILQLEKITHRISSGRKLKKSELQE